MSSATRDVTSPSFIPRRREDWVNLRSSLVPRIDVADGPSRIRRNRIALALFSLSGLLYIICIIRACYLRRFYLIKRDSKNQWRPHLCLLFSLFGLIEVGTAMSHLIIQEVIHGQPFNVKRLIVTQCNIFNTHVMGGLWTWGMWCAIPSSPFHFRKATLNPWHRKGPWVILIVLIVAALYHIILTVSMVRKTHDAPPAWTKVKNILDEITSKPPTSDDVSQSVKYSRPETEALILLMNFKQGADVFNKLVFSFSKALLVTISVLLGMFTFASTSILRALAIQIKHINIALGRTAMLRQPNPDALDGHGGVQLQHTPESTCINKLSRGLLSSRSKLFENFLNFLRAEEIDYSVWDTPICEEATIHQDQALRQKLAGLRRHWWRIVIQVCIGLPVFISYLTIAGFLTFNFWNLGNGTLFTQVDPILHEWRNWTWIGGPGILLACIICVVSFLEEQEEEAELPVTTQRESMDDVLHAVRIRQESSNSLTKGVVTSLQEWPRNRALLERQASNSSTMTKVLCISAK